MKRGVIEVVDGDTAGAYAWLAVGGFNPPVVSIPDSPVDVRCLLGFGPRL
ncbi:MAG: hypothetical protein R3F11_03345 [Verrucomicrobiales bacterium]